MGFVVKTTTKIGLLDLLCPYTCRGCGRLGDVLCECCKNDIVAQKLTICPLCKRELETPCEECGKEFDEIFVVGWREGALKKLVADFKYDAVRKCGDVLVELMTARMEGFDEQNVVVVPLPTIRRHVRERGFDHTLVLAKKIARRRGWEVELVLGRAKDTVQVGASAADRRAQAKKAYEVTTKVDATKTYVLLDDVWTTGASMRAAAEALREAGAEKIVAALIAVGRAEE